MDKEDEQVAGSARVDEPRSVAREAQGRGESGRSDPRVGEAQREPAQGAGEDRRFANLLEEQCGSDGLSAIPSDGIESGKWSSRECRLSRNGSAAQATWDEVVRGRGRTDGTLASRPVQWHLAGAITPASEGGLTDF